MADSLPDQIVQKIADVRDFYHRLVLVVASEGSGKTAALQAVAERVGALRININLELSRRLLDVTERQRPLQVQRLLGDILAETDAAVILLDNVEILFDPKLQQDPLRCLQLLARQRTVVATWGGTVSDSGVGPAQLTYATPGHPEYRRYFINDVAFVSPTTAPVG